MINYDWDFSIVWQYRNLFVKALWTTIELIVLTIVLAITIGFVLALLRMRKNPVPRYAAILFIEFHRAVPPLVLLVWVYYCLPILIGVSPTAFQTGVIGLAAYTAAFYAEIFRAGLQSIEKGLIEAGHSVGMTNLQILRRITGPLAFQRIFPPFISQGALVIKNTVLASYIAVGELLYEGQRLSIHTFRPMEILTVVALLFVGMILPLTFLAHRIEARARQKFA
jgi:polar amino acid transport system permease protein